MTTKDSAVELTRLNIHAIFGEKNSAKRLTIISSLWAPDNELLFVDAHGVYKTHSAISSMVGKIQTLGGPSDAFTELSDVECLKYDDEEDVWVTKVKWGVGPKGDDMRVTGWDVVTIVGGRIKACYTFLDPK